MRRAFKFEFGLGVGLRNATVAIKATLIIRKPVGRRASDQGIRGYVIELRLDDKGERDYVGRDKKNEQPGGSETPRIPEKCGFRSDISSSSVDIQVRSGVYEKL